MGLSNEFSPIRSEQEYLEFVARPFTPACFIEKSERPFERRSITCGRYTSHLYYLPAKLPIAGNAPNPDRLSLGTYNVLFDGYLAYNRLDQFDDFEFSNVDPAGRRLRLCSRIMQLDADLLATQETSQQVFLDVLAFLPEYAGVYMDTQGQGRQGVAIFFRASKFEPFDWQGVAVWHSSLRRNKGALRLALSWQGEMIELSSVHLSWVEEAMMTPEMLEQLRAELRGFISHLGCTGNRCPKMLLGDFNLEPSVVTGVLSEEPFTAFNLLLSDMSYATAPLKAQQVERRIDHVVYDAADTWTVSERLVNLPFSAEKTEILSEHEPSDHLPVLAYLGMRS